MTDLLVRREASAALCELLALGFSYPDQELYSALNSGSFSADAATHIARLDNPAPLRDALEQLVAGIRIVADTCPLEKLESQYLELFELNRNQAPLHLNAHLYAPGQADPVTMYRQLQGVYRAFGLELKVDPRVEAPDHLTLQLEFLAYLYRLHGSLVTTREQDAAARAGEGIETFLGALAWIHRFVALLQDRSAHPFYVPLAGLLQTLLVHAAEQPAARG
jgi:DMSO reductase family type II enzyme chaperone